MLRHEVRAIDYVCGGPVPAAIWREGYTYARAELVSEGRVFST